MEISSAQYGSLFISIVMSKITPELWLCIARETKKNVWKNGELLDLIKQEVEAREASEQVKAHAIKLPGGVTPITQLAHLFQILQFTVCIAMKLIILLEFQSFKNART